MPSKHAILIVSGLLIVSVAAFLRLSNLSDRPLHGDEAVNAFKVRDLREGRGFQYDPHEYHGPTLYYFSRPLVAAASRDFEDSTEADYRLFTAIAGVLLVAVTVGFFGAIGAWAAVFAAILTTLSLGMTFYSRYYIHEMPLVLFTAATLWFGWKYAATRRVLWAVLCGVSVGCMHATKETFVIALFGMGVAVAVDALSRKCRSIPERVEWLRVGPLLLGVGVASAISVVLFSSFFSNWQGVPDSIRTYAIYLERSGGVGSDASHAHPWYWYLQRLMWHRPIANGPWYSEAIIPLLAVVGCVVAVTRCGIAERHVRPARFLAIYVGVTTFVYCSFSYKTPWSMMSFVHGMTLLAGIGATGLIHMARHRPLKGVLVVVLLAGVGHLAWQDYRGNLAALKTHRTNPYIYAHPNDNVRLIGEQAEALQAVNGGALTLVIYRDENIWPVPFYLRRITTVGELTDLDAVGAADVIFVAGQSEEAVVRRHGETHFGPIHFGVRPNVVGAMLVQNDLWDAYLKSIE